MSTVNGNGHNGHLETSMVEANGNGVEKTNGNGYHPQVAPQYHGGYQGGGGMSRTLTAGGHLADDDLLAIGNAHRKIANPLPLGVFGFSTTTLLLSLYNAGVQSITVPNAIIGFALAYGGMAQFLAGLWEFASGNTFGATVFCSFGCFWWGFSMILIPFFGFEGSYNGQPGLFTEQSPFASQADSCIGLYLWIWFGITTIYLIASLRGSVALFALIFALWITFILLGAHYYTGSAKLATAGGAWGIITAIFGFYLGQASFMTRYNSFFTLPVIPLGKKD